MAILNHLSILGLKLVHVNKGTLGLPTVSVSAHSVSLRWRHNEHDGVSHLQPYDCLLNRLFRRRSKKIPKLRVTGLCAGNSPVTGEFPAQKASNAENVFIWWRHHGRCLGHSSLVPLIPQLRLRWTNPYPPHNQFSKVSGYKTLLSLPSVCCVINQIKWYKVTILFMETYSWMIDGDKLAILFYCKLYIYKIKMAPVPVMISKSPAQINLCQTRKSKLLFGQGNIFIQAYPLMMSSSCLSPNKLNEER